MAQEEAPSWTSIRRTIVAVYCLFHASSRNPSRIKLVVKDPSPPRLCEKWTNALISRLDASRNVRIASLGRRRGIGGEPRDPRRGRSFSRTFRYPWNEKRSELWNLSSPFQVNDPGIRNIRPKLDRSENLSRRPRFEKKKKKTVKSKLFESLLSSPSVDVDLAIDRSIVWRREINKLGSGTDRGTTRARRCLLVLHTRALARMQKSVARKTRRRKQVPAGSRRARSSSRVFPYRWSREMGSRWRMTAVVVNVESTRTSTERREEMAERESHGWRVGFSRSRMLTRPRQKLQAWRVITTPRQPPTSRPT